MIFSEFLYNSVENAKFAISGVVFTFVSIQVNNLSLSVKESLQHILNFQTRNMAINLKLQNSRTSFDTKRTSFQRKYADRYWYHSGN